MRINFNLPEAVENITITFEGNGKKKEYKFTQKELKMFHDDHKLQNYMNSFIGPDWPKSMLGKKSPRSKVSAGNEKRRQMAVGRISNLISDMTIAGATEDELRKAVEYSKAVLNKDVDDDALRKIFVDNGIEELSAKYSCGAAKNS